VKRVGCGGQGTNNKIVGQVDRGKCLECGIGAADKMMSIRIDRKRKEMKWRRTDGEKAESWKAVELESCSIKLVYL